MNLTDREYQQLVQAHAGKSPKGKNAAWAFCVGGGICVVGQLLTALYQRIGLPQEDAGTWTTITLIALAALFTALRWYDKLARHAGAGTLVPVTGFANSIAAPAMDFKTEGFVTGMAAKMFQIAGPVIVFSLGASVLYGLALCLLG